jgi:membrane protein DedA with SNARE-associated domain
MMTDQILEFVDTLPAPAVYAFLIFSTMFENIFPPWPGDTIVVFTGFIAARGTVTLFGLTVAGLIGNLLGAYLMYFAGEGLLAHARALHDRTENQWLKKQLDSLVSEQSMQ